MNTKVKESLGAIRDVERREDSIAAHVEKLNERIAQQDATIARAVNEVAQFREVAAENDRLREALAQLLGWVDAWSPNFTEDADWPEHESQIRAALNQEQAK